MVYRFDVEPDDLVAGVDTHKDSHSLAVLTAQGGLLLTADFSADKRGYEELVAVLNGYGRVVLVGVEGTSSYGAGLTRALVAAGFTVKEVLRPTRQVRRLNGKSDSIDAVEAARTVLAGHWVSDAKDTDSPAESVRQLLIARSRLVSVTTALSNCILALLMTAPDDVRTKYRHLPTAELTKRLAACRPGGDLAVPRNAALHAMRELARSCEDAKAKSRELEQMLQGIIEDRYPHLLEIYGAGTLVVAQLIVTAGGNPERIRSEAAFAALCGVSPIPASSGRVQRHRLNRGGDRHANSALHRIAIVRLRHDERTQLYVRRKVLEGKSKKEALRCVKRAIAREVFRVMAMRVVERGVSVQALRTLRKSKGLTQTEVALSLGVTPARISDIERGRRKMPALKARYETWLAAA